MKLSLALFFAGLFGALGALCVLLSFGTDYWLLASESCWPGPSGAGSLAVERGELMVNSTTFYHEGFFWKCSSTDDSADDTGLLWKLWLTNQPQSKVCVHAYLFPFPVDSHAHNATNYQSAISVLLLAVVVMYVLWLQALDVVALYVDHQRATACPAFRLSLHYGPSFMLAPVGIFFALLSGLLFLLIGRSIQVTRCH
ncbi:hypothetical protein CRUP_000178 [Coryphaenoides rupestris]|nr:hypothetical protein CRUP_000178 [Coryphaenoides rupestris]